jgi:hypothetical protein
MNRSAALNARPKGNAAKPAMKVQKISKKNSDPPLKANQLKILQFLQILTVTDFDMFYDRLYIRQYLTLYIRQLITGSSLAKLMLKYYLLFIAS